MHCLKFKPSGPTFLTPRKCPTRPCSFSLVFDSGHIYFLLQFTHHYQSFGSNSRFTFLVHLVHVPWTRIHRSSLMTSTTSRPSATTNKPRPSIASHLRDPDQPVIVSTTVPKKARTTDPPPSLRTSTTSRDPDPPSSGSTFSISSPTTKPTPSDLFGFILKPNGERVRFLIPRPPLDFQLPEAKS